MSPRPTATVDTGTRPPRVVFTRDFAAPLEDVWAAVSAPDRLARWIGTLTGDPATGHVVFRMGEDGAEDEAVEIHVCEPPRHWSATTRSGGEAWSLTMTLSETSTGTHLEFTQVLTDVDQLPSFGPGWEFYLDRLAAELGGQPVEDVDWEEYYPAMRAYFEELRP